jgi:hypothetical protein
LRVVRGGGLISSRSGAVAAFGDQRSQTLPLPSGLAAQPRGAVRSATSISPRLNLDAAAIPWPTRVGCRRADRRRVRRAVSHAAPRLRSCHRPRQGGRPGRSPCSGESAKRSSCAPTRASTPPRTPAAEARRASAASCETGSRRSTSPATVDRETARGTVRAVDTEEDRGRDRNG